ncbi:MAG TPA: pectate lyase, partial [Polyangia bacterium]|nr:pectate lyase [Polyangia bacterium]
QIPTWPTPTGSPVNISGTKSVSGVYDGGMALHNGTLNDCTKGDQSSTKAIIEIADGGTVKNVIFGADIGDGIHCLGSCTIDNVWFPYVCDDAITMLGGSGKTATITNSGFMGARDKTIQHNGDGSTVVIDHVYVNIAGKLYRSCGDGCSSSAKRTAKISNVVAIGASEIAGVSTNDHATLSNICAYRTPSLCRTYKPGSETETTTGANGTNEGPDANCSYAGTDTHALLSDVTGSFQTDVLCPGSNSVKTGSTATACVSGFESCLKGCAPGSYGFKPVTCNAGTYADTGVCDLPSDPSIAAHFAGSNAASATMTVTSNDTCTTEWAWATDGSGKYCMCVYKPGYYQQSSTSWMVWDCQSQWW